MAWLFLTKKASAVLAGLAKKNSLDVLELIRTALAERDADIAALMEATGFTTKNLSSMLNGAGKHAILSCAFRQPDRRLS